MKKVWCSVLIVVFLLSLSGCTPSSSASGEADDNVNTEAADSDNGEAADNDDSEFVSQMTLEGAAAVESSDHQLRYEIDKTYEEAVELLQDRLREYGAAELSSETFDTAGSRTWVYVGKYDGKLCRVSVWTLEDDKGLQVVIEYGWPADYTPMFTMSEMESMLLPAGSEIQVREYGRIIFLTELTRQELIDFYTPAIEKIIGVSEDAGKSDSTGYFVEYSDIHFLLYGGEYGEGEQLHIGLDFTDSPAKVDIGYGVDSWRLVS